MLDPVAVVLKFGFLAVLYLFLMWVVVSALRDLRRGQDASMEVEADHEEDSVSRRAPALDLAEGVSPQLIVEEGNGPEVGAVFDIKKGATIGRAANADIALDDAFASHMHARVFIRGPFLFIEDMGSTNGTFLNGRRLRREEQLKVQDRIRIGDTEFRYEE